MADEQGVKTEEQAAAAAGQQQQSGTESQDQDEQRIPKPRFDEVNEAKNRAQAENAVLREQLKIVAANPPQVAPAPVAGQGYKHPDYTRGLKIEPDENMSGEDALKLAQQVGENVAENIDQRYGATAAAMQFQVSHPDYPTVVGADGVMAPALTKYLQKNPLALNQIGQHPNPTQYLYTLGKAAIEAEKAQASKGEGDDKGQQKTGEETPPGSPSMVGGGRGSIRPGSQFATMSKEELEKFVAQAKNQPPA